METERRIKTTQLQTHLKQFEPATIPYGDISIDVISDPHTLPREIKEDIVEEIRPITQKGFGENQPVDPKEVRSRTVDPKISLLLLARKKDTGQIIGYFSTRVLNGDTIHLHASVFHPEHQGGGNYPFVKLMALGLEKQKMELHGLKPKYISAQSFQPDVICNLVAHEGMLPAPLHPRGSQAELQRQAERTSTALDGDGNYERTTGIRRRALKLKRAKGMADATESEIQDALLKLEKKPALKEKVEKILKNLERSRGDALLLNRKLDKSKKNDIQFAVDQLVPKELHPLLLAELLLGQHRQLIQEVSIDRSTALPFKQTPTISVLQIKVKPENLNLLGLTEAIENQIKLRTAFGLAWSGSSQSRTSETDFPQFNQLGPTIRVPLGPTVPGLLKILKRNLKQGEQRS